MTAINGCDTSDEKTLSVSISCRKGLNHLNGYKSTIYPNPTNDYAILTYNLNSTNGLFQITNAMGNVLKKYHLLNQSGDFEFDTNDLPNGVYQCIIWDGKTDSNFTRLVIIH